MTPFFEVWSNGQDISGRMREYGIECVITENAGGNSDTVTFSITDPDAVIGLPPKGTEFNLVAGLIDPLSGERLERDFGLFKVDQSNPSGYPHRIDVSAQSLDVGSKIKQKRTRAFKAEDYPTIGDILRKIAADNDLEPRISDDVASEVNRYQAQSEEDDVEFVTRLCAKFDAMASVKNGKLVVIKKGLGKTASGTVVDPYLIAYGRNLIDDGGYSAEDVMRPVYGRVIAKWYDREKAEHIAEEEQTEEDGPDFEIAQIHPSQQEAKTAARTKANELNRATGKATFKTAGDPFVQAGCFVLAQGIRAELNGLWASKSISHHFLSESYYYNSFQCEVPTQGRKKAAEAASKSQSERDPADLENFGKPPELKPSPYAPNFENLGLNEGDGPE